MHYYRIDDQPVALKDYSGRPWWIRVTLGRWLIRREFAAYRALEGVAGLPRCHGRIGRDALALEWLPGRSLADVDRSLQQPAWFDTLEQIVGRVHAAGVALGDLHHRDVLVDGDGEVHVVDLATAWVLGRRPGRLRRGIFVRLRDADRIGLARMRARAEGREADEAIDEIGGAAASWHRRGRKVKGWIDRLRRR